MSAKNGLTNLELYSHQSFGRHGTEQPINIYTLRTKTRKGELSAFSFLVLDNICGKRFTFHTSTSQYLV